MLVVKLTKKEKNRFSIVELLCLVVIVGLILFMAFNRLLPFFKVKADDTVSLEATITKAADAYFQKHFDRYPKNIGESSNVSLLDLKKEKFLKEDIYNLEHDSCMTNSYVRSYRLNENEYTYNVYLYCGDESPNEIELVPAPSIQLSFSNDDGEEINSNDFDSIKDAAFMIDINGGQTRGGTLLAIDYYSFTISVLNDSDSEKANVYHSGILYTNRYDHLKFMKKITDYMNMNQATSISITVKVVNVVGGMQEVSLSSSLSE